ncbi:MAG: FAD-binding oxidoreductase [Actinobacteria bacterium]|nr:FAD-binding oxidoreductase [Actinomycetota bacterium]
MTTTDLDLAGLAFQLRREVRGEIRFDPASRALYATDASHYRHVPLGVVAPADVDDVVATLAVCRDAHVPVTTRGAGTSLAGQAANEAVIIDLSRHLRHGIEVDPLTATATVDAGVVLDDLQRVAAFHGLTFGPDPSTQNRATIGGMVGNDACGVHSVIAGRTQDNVEALDVLLYDGTRLTAPGPAAARTDGAHPAAQIIRSLEHLRDDHVDLIRSRFPVLPRRVSGYNLDALLPENGFHVARSLVGTEGTCALVLAATLRLIPRPRHRVVVVLGYPSLASAAEDVVDVLATGPIGLEGIDEHVAAGVGRTRARAELELLPDGSAWLLVEYGGASRAEAQSRADWLRSQLRRAGGGPTVRVVTEPRAQRAVWEVRRAGLGATTFAPGGRARLPGWEDAAVPPERLPAYLLGLADLLSEHRLEAALYGHLGDGCVHAKIDFDHTTPEGRATYRRFVEDAADLTVGLGGSLSGEHGDGQSRSELLERMYGAEVVALFRRFKSIWDPDGMMNPGRIVDPAPLDADLRWSAQPDLVRPQTVFAFADDHGSLGQAASRCVGIGLCRRDDDRATMCPSYRATHDEQHSPRGRAHLLFEMLHPRSELDGFGDESIRAALDLCLSCKACKAECPTGVDIATYKAEFLHQHYHGRIRPRAAYALSLVPWWARAASRAPRLANRILGSSGARRLAGIAPARTPPVIAPETFRRWWKRRELRGEPRHSPDGRDGGPAVVLFPDTFTDRFEPWVGSAAVSVLEDAGFRVEVPLPWLCCGRPLYDSGMLGLARRQLERLVRVLGTGAAPLVVLEPSCLAVFRDELPAMLPNDERARRLSRRAVSLAELLVSAGYEPAVLPDEVTVQPHCQHAAVVGHDADAALLAATQTRFLDAGCCGMAGSFGFEAGDKHAVSVAVAERRYLPALRELSDDATVIADGFSCRTQTADLAGRRTLHLAEVLAAGLARRESV